MIDRGVDTQKRYLFVVDGSKALVAAIRAAFGQDVQVQRCQEHKYVTFKPISQQSCEHHLETSCRLLTVSP